MSGVYSSYGLVIDSDVDLLSLQRVTDYARSPDVTVRRVERIHWNSPPAVNEPEHFEEVNGIVRFSWLPVGSLEVQGREHVNIAPVLGASDAQISLPFFGPIMARLLHAHALLTLHGSTLRSASRAAVFLGDKGAGKSTLAAALLASGYDLINDDLVGIDMISAGRPEIRRGYPHFRVLPDTLRAIDLSSFADYPSPAPWFPKVIKAAPAKYEGPFRGPTTILILKRGDELGCRRLEGAAALAQIMRFSQMALFPRFGWVLNPGDQARHFAQCAALSRVWPVLELQVPQGLEHISATVDLIGSEYLA